MYCIAKYVGSNCYDVIVWEDFTDSIDDPGVKAVNRKTVFVPENEEFPSDYIRAVMDLTICDSIDLE